MVIIAEIRVFLVSVIIVTFAPELIKTEICK